jgi:hypothetical protein
MSNTENKKINQQDFEVFGNSDQGYTDYNTGSNSPSITGPQSLTVLTTEASRWQCQFCLDITLFIFIVLASIFIGTFLGLVYRGTNGSLNINRPNMTLLSTSKSLVPGEDAQLIILDEEKTISEIIFNSTDTNIDDDYYEDCTTLGAIRVANRARDGYVNATEGHMSFWTSNTNGTLMKAIHIDEQQNVGIGTSFPSSELTVDGTITTTNPVMIACDERIKTDINDITFEEALKVMEKVNAKRYRRKGSDRIEAGFIAQDFLKAGAKDVIIKMKSKDGIELIHLDSQAVTAYLWTVVQGLITKN